MAGKRDRGSTPGGFSKEELGAVWTLAQSMFRRRAFNRSNVQLLGRTAAEAVTQAGGISGLRSLLGERLSGPTKARPASRPVAAPKPPAPRAPNQLGGAVLVGGSRATGTARVLRGDEKPGPIEGEILVCARIEPDWVAALGSAAAIVVETGAPSTRAIRLARQLNVPTVRLAEATRLIPDRARLSVDAEVGLVILDEAGASPAS